ncbi:endonuclease III [Candidatus Bathyarchaeota archaeon]|nr:endonuclease III [Candidatus Bathyarchaeota archaeon]MBS7630288.1 endonuclease III [Candidatus Bathyarchaeota archaeon]
MSEEDELGKVDELLLRLEKNYPEVNRTALNWETPLDILVATILSAQTTDAKVNEVTKTLFKKYRTAEDYVKVSREELEKDIHSLGFFRQKAKFVQEACKQIIEDYGGSVPNRMEDLIKLKGVARKTANIVLSNAFGVVEGIAVDTHVMRLSKRLGLTSSNDRNKIEEDLMKIVPKERWFSFSNLIIEHGRRICSAQKPKCDVCVLNDLCPSAFSFTSNNDVKQ